MKTRVIEITVKGEAGVGKSTISSRIAMLLANDGFDVVVNDSDEIRAEFDTPERIETLLKQDMIISICHVQEPRKSD